MSDRASYTRLPAALLGLACLVLVVVSAADAPPPNALTPVVVDVNSAPAQRLELLPGIGPAMAGRIVADRAENGPFQSIDDLRRVRGIGPKTAAAIAPHAVAGPAGLE